MYQVNVLYANIWKSSSIKKKDKQKVNQLTFIAQEHKNIIY